MPSSDHSSTRTRRRLGRVTAVTVLGLVLGLGLLAPVTSSAADSARGARTGAAVATAQPRTFTEVLGRAKARLDAAVLYLTDRQYPSAIEALSRFRASLVNLHDLGMTNINPDKVVKTFDLEHQAAMQLLPAWDGLANGNVRHSLQPTLETTFFYRIVMLDRVIAEPEEGPVDWDDAMADTLPIYAAETSAYRSALEQFELTPRARTALTKDFDLVRTTRQKFTGRFGGGE